MCSRSAPSAYKSSGRVGAVAAAMQGRAAGRRAGCARGTSRLVPERTGRLESFNVKQTRKKKSPNYSSIGTYSRFLATGSNAYPLTRYVKTLFMVAAAGLVCVFKRSYCKRNKANPAFSDEFTVLDPASISTNDLKPRIENSRK